jgi:hypothetical protein
VEAAAADEDTLKGRFRRQLSERTIAGDDAAALGRRSPFGVVLLMA